MSELMNTQAYDGRIRRKLIATASGLVLLACMASHGAYAEDEGRPTVWIELGGQLEHVSAAQDPFTPPFLLKEPRPSFETVYPVGAESPPRHSIGGEGRLSFQPEGSNWVFSGSVRYGRSNGNKVVHQQTSFNFANYPSFTPYDDNYADTKATHKRSHTIVDFQAGKDFGLGMFGAHSSSTFSLGMRYAQFSSKSTVDVRERPDLHAEGIIKYFHSYHLSADSARSFHGVGPSLSWDASAPFVGNPETTEFTFDWGLNAAVLFGRQRADVTHHTNGRYVKVKYGTAVPQPYQQGNARNSVRSVTVPNLGGFAGLSVRFPNAKVSLGYRADFFFGAMDAGVDARKSTDMSFHGPFAKISVGFGG